MENEFQILDNLDKNKNATQRDIARYTGMSLGNVNTLIKRLVRKGMLKIERLSSKSIRYILTPEGMKEKAEKTYRYIVSSYQLINDVNEKIDLLLQGYLCNDTQQFILFGSKDEICEILEYRFKEIGAVYESISCIDKVKENNYSSVFVWHPEYASQLDAKGIHYINLLDKIQSNE